MKKKKNELTAEDLVQQLNADPAYQAKLRTQTARAARVRDEETHLLRVVAHRGYPSDSLHDLVESNAPLPQELAEALVDVLPNVTEPALQESLVRALGAAGASFNVQPLVFLFEATQSEPLRWAIANTLAELRPLEMRQWLLAALRNRAYGKAREMLALAVARTSAAKDANPALLDLLDEMPGHAALALAESGSATELEALRVHGASAKGWAKEEINKAIRAIRRRT